nr:DKNYY domain-containing protein [Allomuricauda sp.]
MKFKAIHILIIPILLMACGEGYKKIDGNWAWVLHSEAGKHVRKINADISTFTILDSPEYARDKNSVYWRGFEIENCDPETFKVITENGYAKDKKNVYLDTEIVIFANPSTFEIIEWPYAKDDERIFNGNLPMNVDNIEEFEITKSSGMKTSSTKSFFIKQNEGYTWLDTLSVNAIITGGSAEAKTQTQKFKGYKRVE